MAPKNNCIEFRSVTNYSNELSASSKSKLYSYKSAESYFRRHDVTDDDSHNSRIVLIRSMRNAVRRNTHNKVTLFLDNNNLVTAYQLCTCSTIKSQFLSLHLTFSNHQYDFQFGFSSNLRCGCIVVSSDRRRYKRRSTSRWRQRHLRRKSGELCSWAHAGIFSRRFFRHAEGTNDFVATFSAFRFFVINEVEGHWARAPKHHMTSSFSDSLMRG